MDSTVAKNSGEHEHSLAVSVAHVGPFVFSTVFTLSFFLPHEWTPIVDPASEACREVETVEDYQGKQPSAHRPEGNQ